MHRRPVGSTLPALSHLCPDTARPPQDRSGWGSAYHRHVWHDDPLPLQSHPIAAVLRIPIDILHADAVSKRTLQALFARGLIEPLLERRIRVPPVRITRGDAASEEHSHAQRYHRHCWTDESAHHGLQSSVLADQNDVVRQTWRTQPFRPHFVVHPHRPLQSNFACCPNRYRETMSA